VPVRRHRVKGIGQRIKGSLSNRQQPVIIDDVTTPVASRMLQDVDNTISRLRIQNRADPLGPPNPENIVGVNLQGVDQARKRLVSMASSAMPGSADRRAASAVIGEFDNHIEDAIGNGLFTGSDRALDALKQARAAYSQYRQTFRSQGAGDDVGRVMEKIIGRNGNEGATPTEVANWLYGQAKVGGTGLSVRLAQHIARRSWRRLFEWSAIRQGLWQRLTSATDGVTQMGPARIANRIAEFLNGSGQPLAQSMFSAQERMMMEKFANLHRQLEPKAGAVNYSNTAPVLAMLVRNAFRGVIAALGAGLDGGFAGGVVGHIIGGQVAKAGEKLSARSAAGRVARSLYMTPQMLQRDARFAERMGRHGALLSRMVQSGFHPAAIGARQALDGLHYLPDPAMPGRYVRIDYRGA